MSQPKDLSGLEAAIGGAIDEISDDGVAARGVDLPGSEEDPKKSEDESDPDKETPSPESENAAGEETPSPEGETDPDAAPKDLLEGLSDGERKAILKFAPNGQINTAEELADAKNKLIDDYWRNHTRLAEMSRESKPKEEAEPPKAPEKKEEVVAPEVKRYDDRIQSIIQRADKAENQKRGWQEELSTVEAKKRDLRSKLNRGDSTVDANEILALDERCDEIRGHIAGWDRAYGKCKDEYGEALARKQEVQTILSARDRLDRQEKEAKDLAQRQANEAYDRNINGAITHVSTPAKAGEQALVPAEEKERFGKYLRFAIEEHFRNAPQTKIDDLHVFAADVAKVFMGPVTRARIAAKETYNKDKAADAPPKPPVPKKKPGAPARDKKDGPASMADLESLVTGHTGWQS